MGETTQYLIIILEISLFLFLLQSLLHFLSQLDEITHQVSLCHGVWKSVPITVELLNKGTRQSVHYREVVLHLKMYYCYGK